MQASSGIGLQGVLLKPVTQSVLFNTLLNVFCSPVHPAQSAIKSTYIPSDLSAYEQLRGKRVLVTDDNALNREVATDFLEYVGVQVFTAVDGRDAIAQLQQHEVDAVLMDIHMPEMNGLEATREIRKHARWAQLPIIALTAQTRSEDQLLSREAGMNGHLTKPIDEVALYTTLIELCVAPTAATSVSAAHEEPVAAPELAIFSRLSASPQRKANLLRGFLSDFETLPQTFEKYLEQGALFELGELVHQIKGSAGYLDSRQLCSVADVIERAAHNSNMEVVQDLSEEFQRLVHDCLERVRQGLQLLGEVTPEPAGGGAVAAAKLRSLLQKAAPLVESGDFGAKALLEELVQGTASTPWHSHAQQALDAFDDLEIDQTRELLSLLEAQLNQESPANRA